MRFLLILIPVLLQAQSSGVGNVWTRVSGTLQSAATADGNGTALAVGGLSSASFTVNCSVACSGGTTINLESSENGTNYTAVLTNQLGTNTITSTIINQGTTITQWSMPLGSAISIRARISSYSAGTITITASATAAPYVSLAVNTNGIAGTAVLGHIIADTGSTTAATQATGTNLHAVIDSGSTTAVTQATGSNLHAVLDAGAAVIGHTINDTGSTTAVTGNVAVTQADGSNTTLGAKADAKSTATDTTAISAMQVFKQISASVQAPPSQAVTNAGTFAVQSASTLAAETTKVIGTARIVGSTGNALDAATAAAVPGSAFYIGGVGSGNLTGLITCDNYAKLDMTTATTTEIVALAASKIIYICSYSLFSNGTTTGTIKYGTGTNCGTGTTSLSPAWEFTAQTGIARGTGIGMVMKNISANALCVTNSAAVNLHAEITYTQF